jgi:hypothetical protein
LPGTPVGNNFPVAHHQAGNFCCSNDGTYRHCVEAQKQVLRTLGCSEVQHYLFSAAKSADQITELFASYSGGGALQQQQGRRKAAL